MTAIRQTEQAFAWVEHVLGGRIVAKVQEERWRPQWFLDVETAAGEPMRVVLRGFRNPGSTSPDERHSRATLRFEAEVLRYLEPLPVKSPKFYGHNEELGWLLMERVPGDAALTEVVNPETRHHIYRQYLDDIATLHSLPLDAGRLPAGIDIPANTQAVIARYLEGPEAMYRSHGERPQAEPLFEFGLRWLRDHPLEREGRIAFGLADVGPNQFMFEGATYRSLIDFEFSFIADPLFEIGLMRCRETGYPIGRFGELVQYYGERYEALTGAPLDLDAVQYWTIFAAVVTPLMFNSVIQRPSPLLPEQAFLYAFESMYRRCLPEALAEYHGIQLDPPKLPEDGQTILTPLHDLLVARLEGPVASQAQNTQERMFAQSSTALARTLARGDRFGARLSADNLDELAVLLGERPVDVPSGLRMLEAMVAADYKSDIEARVRFFYRFEMRREFLYAPMKQAAGCAVFAPLAPLMRKARDR